MSEPAAVAIRRVEPVMGTVVSFSARATPDLEASVRAAVERAVAWLHEVDDRFTTYRDSEWLRWCRGEVDLDRAHPDLRHVVSTTQALEHSTDGAFSITADPSRPPDAAAYVKGWAVQRASDIVVTGGAAAACTNGGGDVVVAGGDRPWRIGITDPHRTDRLKGVIELAHGAVATSGSYERGEHIYRPADHRPATELASVSVIGPDLGLADAYSTAAFALGDAALDWLAGLDGYSSYVVRADGSTGSTACA